MKFERSLRLAMGFPGCMVVAGLLTAAEVEGKKAAPAEAGKAAPSGKEAEKELKTLPERAGYAIGFNMGKQFQAQSIDVDLASLIRGLKDGFSAGNCKLSDSELAETMATFQKEMASRHAERLKQADPKGGADRSKAAEKNLSEGAAFLAGNKTKPGVITLESGLQYKVLEKGTGAIPKATDTVSTHYRGTLINGTEFDSSYSRGQPASFPVSRVIKGWTEALQLMPVGSKWQLFVPSDLAYQEQGFPPKIGPNATLIFEIQLVSIK